MIGSFGIYRRIHLSSFFPQSITQMGYKSPTQHVVRVIIQMIYQTQRISH